MAEQVEIVCGGCGVLFWMTKQFQTMRRQDHKIFFCPAGCQRVYNGPTEEDKLRQERDRLKQAIAYERDRVRAETERRELIQRQARAYKGQVTKLKNRAAAGVCPCCNRTFVNLQRHMANKHSTFLAEEVAPEGVVIQ